MLLSVDTVTTVVLTRGGFSLPLYFPAKEISFVLVFLDKLSQLLKIEYLSQYKKYYN